MLQESRPDSNQDAGLVSLKNCQEPFHGTLRAAFLKLTV